MYMYIIIPSTKRAVIHALLQQHSSTLSKLRRINKRLNKKPSGVTSRIHCPRIRRKVTNLLQFLRRELYAQRTKIFFNCLSFLLSRYDTAGKYQNGRTLTFVVPGMGITSLPCPSSQASAIWLAVALCRSPIFFKPSAILRTLGKFSRENLRT